MKNLTPRLAASSLLLTALLLPAGSGLAPISTAAAAQPLPVATIYQKANKKDAKYRDGSGQERSATAGTVIAIPPCQAYWPDSSWDLHTPTVPVEL